MAKKKAQILVVEDEAIVGIDIQESLEGLGYDVIGVASTGKDAISIATKRKPSLVLMDIMLKGDIDGIDAAKEINAQVKIPVVFLTAHADKSTFARAKVTEPYGYVLKPFKQIELSTVIELALYRYDLESRRSESQPSVVHKEESNSAWKKGLRELDSVTHNDAETNHVINYLSQIEIFKKLDREVLAAITGVCRFETFPLGEPIIYEGDESNSAFFVMSGRVALMKGSASGKDLIVELVSPTDPFGLLNGIQTGPSTFSVKAQLESQILWIPNAVVTLLLKEFPEVSRQLIDKVLERLRNAHDLSRTLAHDRVEVRVASVLLAMLQRATPAEKSGKFPEISLSRQELAEMTGTAPETASRVANALERDGFLDLSMPGKVRILDKAALDGIVELS